jgi:hypothetical protein
MVGYVKLAAQLVDRKSRRHPQVPFAMAIAGNEAFDALNRFAIYRVKVE